MKRLIMIIFLLCIWHINSMAQVLNFTSYHSPAQVDAALTLLNSTYPTLTQISTIGFSILGEPIKALKISDNPGINDTNEGDVVFVAATNGAVVNLAGVDAGPEGDLNVTRGRE